MLTKELRSVRHIEHREAMASLQKFIADHFNRTGKWTVQISIPRQLNDDDVLLANYIEQQKLQEKRLADAERLIREVYEQFLVHRFAVIALTPTDGSKDTRWMKEVGEFLR